MYRFKKINIIATTALVLGILFSFPIFTHAVVDPGGGPTGTEYSFTDKLQSRVQTQPTVTTYFFTPSTGVTVTVSPNKFYSGDIVVGDKYQCFFYGVLTSSTEVTRCVHITDVVKPIDTGTTTTTPTTPSAGSTGSTPTQPSGGPLGVSGTNDIKANAYKPNCPNGTTYSTGLFQGLSCDKPISSLNDAVTLVRNLIFSYILPLVGTLFVIMVIAGGIVYITSAGNPKRIELGKKILTFAIIGLIITVLAYSIVYLFSKAIGG